MVKQLDDIGSAILITGLATTVLFALMLYASRDIELNLRTATNLNFLEPKIFDKINEDLKDNTIFYVTNEPFKFRPNPLKWYNSYYGMYIFNDKQDDWIIVADYANMKRTLCHELMHKQWKRILTDLDRETFAGIVNESGKLSNFEITEMYANLHQDDYYRCYKNETKKLH